VCHLCHISASYLHCMLATVNINNMSLANVVMVAWVALLLPKHIMGDEHRLLQVIR